MKLLWNNKWMGEGGGGYVCGYTERKIDMKVDRGRLRVREIDKDRHKMVEIKTYSK